MKILSTLCCLILLTALIPTQLLAQYDADVTSRYIGVRGLRYQPAAAVDTPYKWDINVVDFNVNVLTEGVLPQLNFFEDISSSGVNQIDDILTIDRNTALFSTGILLPSVIYSINDKSAVMFTTEARAIGTYTISDISLTDIFTGNADDLVGQIAEGEFATTFINFWMEFGFGYAHSFTLGNGDKLKAGGKIKIVSGTGSGFFDIQNISYNYDDVSNISNITADVNFGIDNSLRGIFEGESIEFFNNIGVGIDIGVLYEHINESFSEKDYKWKLGLTINDLGSVKYEDARELSQVNISRDELNTDEFSGIQDLDEFADQIENVFNVESNQGSTYSVRLPLSVIMQFDWNFNQKFYLHVNGNFTQVDPQIFTQRIDNFYTIQAVPRYEKVRWGVYLPLSYNNNTDFSAGLAFKWRFVSLGSSTLFSKIFEGEASPTNLYLGFKVPIYKDEYKRK